MKKPKHTSGPWLITTIDGEDCLMVGGGDGSEVVADIRTHQPESEVEANAHLISSAPEMYAALKGAQECIRKALPLIHDPDDPIHNGAQVQCGEWLDEINEAIAHAEGREIGTDSKALKLGEVLKLGEGMRTIDLKEADKCEPSEDDWKEEEA